MEPINTYSSIYPTEVTNRETSDLINVFLGEKVEVELNDLWTSEHSLKKSIPITLRYEDQCYVVTQEELNMWGESSTMQGAEKELAFEIVKLYERLLSLENQNVLGPYPQELLAYLKQFIS